MKFSISLAAVALTCSTCCVAAAGNCSLGIARWSGMDVWDITVYNVPQASVQLENIISTTTNAFMGKGDSIVISSGVPDPITITNVNNAPAFDYDVPELKVNMEDYDAGLTKVLLNFEIKDTGLNWTTADCGAGSVVVSGGIESWNCDFGCTAAISDREL